MTPRRFRSQADLFAAQPGLCVARLPPCAVVVTPPECKLEGEWSVCLRNPPRRGPARLDQIIDLKHELVQLAGKIDWSWIDHEIAPLYSENGRPGIETRFMIGLLLRKHIYGLSEEGVCELRAFGF